MKKLIAIVGGTATGKTTVAISLAGLLDTEIISADSAQVYKGLDIGTAKVRPEETQGIKHHLIDIVGPETEYNASLFCQDAENAVAEITQRNKIPILCGGSGMYINSFIYKGYDLGAAAGDPKKRKAYLDMEEAKGKGYLHRLLTEKFPRRAEKIHPNDYQRTIRALEMTEDITDEELSEKWESSYDLRIFGLTRNRENLYQAIESRIDDMFGAGLVQEVEMALKQGYPIGGNAMSALGYKEVIPVIQGRSKESQAKELLKKNTRHFAKRQVTWFKRDPNIKWYDVEDYKDPKEIALNIFTQLKQEKFVY